jgi:hypothetical protein
LLAFRCCPWISSRPDAPIAASVEAAGATLVTLKRHHFPMLAEVLVPDAKGRIGVDLA